MRLSWIRAGVALLSLSIAAPAVAQDGAPGPEARPAPPEFTIDVSGWQGGAFGRPDNQQFSHCGVSRPYDDTVLVFSLNPAMNFNIGIIRQGWGLTEGETGEARVRVDEAFDETFEIIPGSPEAYVIPTGPNEALFTALARGNTATITTPRGEYRFPLTGTMAALRALNDCIVAARELIAELPAAGGAGQGSQPGPQGEIIGAQGFGMTLQDLVGLLNAAGFSDFGVADPGSIRRDPLQLNHAWELDDSGDVIGGLHQEPRGDEVEIDIFAKRYLDIMKSGCPTDWTVEEEDALIMANYATKIAELSCTLNGQPIFASALFTLDDNFYTVFFHQATPDNRDRASAATRQLGDFITGLMREAELSAAGASDAPADEPAEEPAEEAPAP